MSNEYRVVYAIPARAFESGVLDEQEEPHKGIFKVLYEETQDSKGRRITPINSDEFFDDPAEIFIATGYSKIIRSSSQSLVKISVKPNDQQSNDPNHKNFIGYHQQAKQITQEQVGSFFKVKLPDASNPLVVLPYKPLTRYVYIVEDGTAYGPFLAEKIDDTGIETTYVINPPSPNDFKNNKGLIGAVYKFDFQEAANKGEIIESDGYINSFSTSTLLSKVEKEIHEFLTPSVINGIINMALRDQSGGRKKSSMTGYAIKAIDMLKSSSFSISIKQNIKSHLNNLQSNNWDKDLLDSLYEIVTENKQGKELIQATYKDKKEELELGWRGEFEEKSNGLKEELKALEVERSTLQTELDNTRRAIAKEEDRLKNTESQVIGLNGEILSEEEAAKLRKELDHITQDLNVKRGEYDSLMSKYGKYKTIEEIETKTNKAEGVLEHFKKELATLESSVKSTKELLSSNESQLQEKLRELAPFVSTLIKAPLPQQVEEFTIESREGIVEICNETPSKQQEIATELLVALQARLSSRYNRNISLTSLSSILVAQQQSFLSIFSGPPGVGKTSFYRILQNIMQQEDYSLEVPVGKGWISEREFIGFYNSLTEKFAPAPSGIYQYLKAIESLTADSIPPTTILLDEANLSPIEQYWAPFLVMADVDSDKVLRLSDGTIKIPDSIRFVGTTNHDMTTEPLSARLIDRAPIIPMDLIINTDDDNDILVDAEHISAYSASSLESMFGTNSVFSSDIFNESLQLLEKIYSVLQDKNAELGQRFIISQRKKQNIENYVSTLGPIIARCNSIERSHAERDAIDYAVLYFLLPLISGTGEQLGKRLEELLSLVELRQLSLSVEKLKDMIGRSKYTLDTFSFFQY